MTTSDNPSTLHPEYIKHQHQVKLVDDVYNGIDNMGQYMFKFPQELDATFNDRVSRATLRNFVRRSIEAFTGMIFRKPIEVTNYAPRTTALFDKIDTKQTLTKFARDVGTSLSKDGCTYILVDSPSSGNSANKKPYLVHIPRQNLINWRKDSYGKFTMIVIVEVISEQSGIFTTTETIQYRVYDEFGNITLWRQNDTTYYIYDSIITEFDYIPIEELLIDKTPMLYDIAKLNVKHFNRLSHKDRYLTMCALPIPVIWGADVNDDGTTSSAKPSMIIGVDEAFIFNSKEDGDFQWRELSGTSIDLLEADLNSITEDITTGVLRASESASAIQKTATEVQLLQAEASNRVGSMASAVEVGLRGALAMLSDFNNETVPPTASFVINKDFNTSIAGTDGQRVVLESYLLGLISIDTYLRSLSDAELIIIESTDAELSRIANDKFIPIPKGTPPSPDNRTKATTKLPPN